MANAAKIDIQGVQWELKDQNARDRIAEMEQKKHIKITQLIDKGVIKLDLVEIDGEKFINLRIWSYVWSGKIGEVIANFTQDIGLRETTGCLMLASKQDRTGRVVVHIDITTSGNLEIYPALEDVYSGNYSASNIYGNAFFKI